MRSPSELSDYGLLCAIILSILLIILVIAKTIKMARTINKKNNQCGGGDLDRAASRLVMKRTTKKLPILKIWIKESDRAFRKRIVRTISKKRGNKNVW